MWRLHDKGFCYKEVEPFKVLKLDKVNKDCHVNWSPECTLHADCVFGYSLTPDNRIP